MARTRTGGDVGLVGFLEGLRGDEDAEGIGTEVCADEVPSSRVQEDSMRVRSLLSVGLRSRRVSASTSVTSNYPSPA